MSLKSLLKKERSTYDIQIDIYNKIYKDCISTIKNVNIGGNTKIEYIVPMFMFGYPVYDVIYMVKKLKKHLSKQGITSEIINNDTLYLSWS